MAKTTTLRKKNNAKPAKAAKAAKAAKVAKPTKPALPNALAKRAEGAASAKLARLVAEAKRDIALIQRRRAEITEAFYDIGEALVRLKRREIVAALGCRSFAELCEKHVGISSAQADRLVDIVEHMTREEALSVGATKAASLVALTRATPEDDTVSDLLERGARIGGHALDVKKASTRAVARAAAEARTTNGARGAGTKGGREVTREERATCVALEKALRSAGAKSADVTVKAGRVNGAAIAIIELAVAEVSRLAKALRVHRP